MKQNNIWIVNRWIVESKKIEACQITETKFRFVVVVVVFIPGLVLLLFPGLVCDSLAYFIYLHSGSMYEKKKKKINKKRIWKIKFSISFLCFVFLAKTNSPDITK